MIWINGIQNEPLYLYFTFYLTNCIIHPKYLKMSRLIPLSFLLLLLSGPNFGQVSGAVKKAEEKVLERAVEKTVNALYEKLFGSETKKDSTAIAKDSTKLDSTAAKQNSSSPLGGIFGSKVVDKTFAFDFSLVTEITTTDQKGKSNVVNTINHFPKDGAYVGAEMESVINIMDFEDMTNYSIVGGNVTIMNLQSLIDKAQKMAKEEEVKDGEETPKLIKTGKKENIAGFECEEYRLESKDMNASHWITQEIGISSEAYFRAFSTNAAVKVPSDTQGIILKMEVYDKKEKSTTVILTTEVKKEKIAYNLSKYKATDLSRFKF